MVHRRVPFAIVALLLTTGLAGCIGGSDENIGTDASVRGDLLPGPGSAAYVHGAEFSQTLVPGAFGILPVELVRLSSADGTMLSAGIFRPDVPEGTLVPVIIDASPYYVSNDAPEDEPAQRLGGYLIETLVPHGFAVVQAAIRGGGYSGGCAELGSIAEQEDVDAFVTYFGEAAWSNGNVGLIGRSYDGTTAFEGAQFGNPHLKTIVPIAGISDWEELYYRNGSAEFRSPVLGTLFTSFGAVGRGGEPQDLIDQACPATAEHPIFGVHGWLNGGGDPGTGSELPYWVERDYRPRILENYEGSVWIIQGLQDWNVKPSQSFPFEGELRAKGLDVKVWAGQWEHAYPDRVVEHDHLRWDWAETLLHWFDKYLRDADVDTGPWVETEDNHGNWRAATQWPADTTTWSTLYLANDGELSPDATLAGAGMVLADTVATEVALDGMNPAGSLTFTSAPFDADTRIAGLPRLHVGAVPYGAGGQLYAEIFTVDGAERTKVGHAQMDLRYYPGGREQQTLVPGEEVVARMEFYPLDVFVPAGHALELVIRQSNFGARTEPLPTVHQNPVEVRWGLDLSTLQLPLAPVDGVHYVTEGIAFGSTW